MKKKTERDMTVKTLLSDEERDELDDNMKSYSAGIKQPKVVYFNQYNPNK